METMIEFSKKLVPYNKQYRDIFGYIPSVWNYAGTTEQYFEALKKAIETKTEIHCFLTKLNDPCFDPKIRY